MISKKGNSSLFPRLVDTIGECFTLVPSPFRTLYLSSIRQRPSKSTELSTLSTYAHHWPHVVWGARWVQGDNTLLLMMDTACASAGLLPQCFRHNGQWITERRLHTYYKTDTRPPACSQDSRVCSFRIKASVPRRRPPYTLPRWGDQAHWNVQAFLRNLDVLKDILGSEIEVYHQV
jgi:hypothetical protein